jgi:hypothetical protein
MLVNYNCAGDTTYSMKLLKYIVPHAATKVLYDRVIIQTYYGYWKLIMDIGSVL